VSLNGDFSAPYGLAFHLPRGLTGLFAAFTSFTGAVRCNLGEERFQYAERLPGDGVLSFTGGVRCDMGEKLQNAFLGKASSPCVPLVSCLEPA
jgi:hypothetical protein